MNLLERSSDCSEIIILSGMFEDIVMELHFGQIYKDE